MCSWFALLCAVDDEIESLRPDEALHILTRLILDIHQTRHGEIPKKRDIWRTTRAGPHDRQKQQHRLETLNQRLILSAQTTLPPTPYQEFLSQITQVWESMKDELTHRQSPQKQQHDENSYLQIRSLTVGLAPFFSILKTEFLSEETISNLSIAAHFDRLQEHISLAIGLQNDLVGLPRDLASSETWNLVLLKTQASPGVDISRAVGEVVRMHNRQVLLAMEVFREIVERCGDRSDYTLVARSMLGFATRHFLWARKAERYRI